MALYTILRGKMGHDGVIYRTGDSVDLPDNVAKNVQQGMIAPVLDLEQAPDEPTPEQESEPTPKKATPKRGRK